jgi:hypothetical protein
MRNVGMTLATADHALDYFLMPPGDCEQVPYSVLTNPTILARSSIEARASSYSMLVQTPDDRVTEICRTGSDKDRLVESGGNVHRKERLAVNAASRVKALLATQV